MTQEELQNKVQDRLFFCYLVNIISFDFLLMLCSVILLFKCNGILQEIPFALCAATKVIVYQINFGFIKKAQEGKSVDFLKKVIDRMEEASIAYFIIGLILLFIK